MRPTTDMYRYACRYGGIVHNAVGRGWAWLESHPLTADAALTLIALRIAVITSHAQVAQPTFSHPSFDAPPPLAERLGLIVVRLLTPDGVT